MGGWKQGSARAIVLELTPSRRASSSQQSPWVGLARVRTRRRRPAGGCRVSHGVPPSLSIGGMAGRRAFSAPLALAYAAVWLPPLGRECPRPRGADPSMTFCCPTPSDVPTGASIPRPSSGAMFHERAISLLGAGSLGLLTSPSAASVFLSGFPTTGGGTAWPSAPALLAPCCRLRDKVAPGAGERLPRSMIRGLDHIRSSRNHLPPYIRTKSDPFGAQGGQISARWIRGLRLERAFRPSG